MERKKPERGLWLSPVALGNRASLSHGSSIVLCSRNACQPYRSGIKRHLAHASQCPEFRVCPGRDSNPGPSPCERGALSTELPGHGSPIAAGRKGDKRR